MYLLASAVERFGPVLLVVPLLLAARAVRGLADGPERMRRGARSALARLGVAAVLLLVWVGAVVGNSLVPASGPRPWLAALLLAAPAVAAVRGTVPVLLAAARSGPAAAGPAAEGPAAEGPAAEGPAAEGRANGTLEPQVRPRVPFAPTGGAAPRALGSVSVVLPARLLPVAAGAAAVLTVAAQSSVRITGLIVFALVGAVVAIDTDQRARRFARRPPTLRWPARGRLVAPLVLVLAAGGCGLAGAARSAVPSDLVLAGHAGHATPSIGPTRDVTDLTGGGFAGPVRSFTLIADEARVPLSSGAVVDGWTFGGADIRVTEGDTVEVRLVNRLDTASTTVHWHGLDVPNAMDGVAGVTQDAVPPGGEFTYRFRAGRPGTYWFHAHQTASVQVARGLFGAIVVEPRGGVPADHDETVLIHDWPTAGGDVLAFGTADRIELRRVHPGSTVRLRVVNTDSFSQELMLTGVPFRLAALDGTDLNEPGELTNERIPLGGGGRADLAFRMPDGPVRFSTGASADAGLVFTPDGTSTIAAAAPGDLLDITSYGRPAAPTPFGPGAHFDREERIDIGEGLGFAAGGLDYLYTINGDVWPNVPALTVREGDLVRVTIANGGLSEHPMHLHGHHVLVLSRDGRATTGSPLWLDTVLVRPGETWEVAFRADNPGIWMDHCHILFHARTGMMLHLQYEGVGTRFSAGSASGNVPE